MRRPREFPAAVGAATPLMAALYLLIGAVGYWAKGEDAPELIIFGMGTGPVARAASAAILLQVRRGDESNMVLFARGKKKYAEHWALLLHLPMTSFGNHVCT